MSVKPSSVAETGPRAVETRSVEITSGAITSSWSSRDHSAAIQFDNGSELDADVRSADLEVALRAGCPNACPRDPPRSCHEPIDVNFHRTLQSPEGRRLFAPGPRGRTLHVVENAAWIRARAEGLLGQWHMPAGRSPAGILAACDRTFPDDDQLEERSVGMIADNERCPVCQGVHAAAERNRS